MEHALKVKIEPMKNIGAHGNKSKNDWINLSSWYSNSPGKRIRQVIPSNINGGPNLLLSKAGPILWKQKPMTKPPRDAQTIMSPFSIIIPSRARSWVFL